MYSHRSWLPPLLSMHLQVKINILWSQMFLVTVNWTALNSHLSSKAILPCPLYSSHNNVIELLLSPETLIIKMLTYISECPRGFEAFEASCYMFAKHEMTFAAAKVCFTINFDMDIHVYTVMCKLLQFVKVWVGHALCGKKKRWPSPLVQLEKLPVICKERYWYRYCKHCTVTG